MSNRIVFAFPLAVTLLAAGCCPGQAAPPRPLPKPPAAPPKATSMASPSRSKEARVPRRELKPDAVLTAIRRQMPRVRACYERALEQDSALDGLLTLNWNVEPAGSVADVEYPLVLRRSGASTRG